MSSIDTDKLFKKPEETPEPTTVTAKYHHAQIEKLKREFSEERRKLESNLWHLKNSMTRSRNPELAIAYDKLKTKLENAIKHRRSIDAAMTVKKEHVHTLNLERNFLVKRIEVVFKKEGLKTILNHIDCPANLRKLMEGI